MCMLLLISPVDSKRPATAGFNWLPAFLLQPGAAHARQSIILHVRMSRWKSRKILFCRSILWVTHRSEIQIQEGCGPKSPDKCCMSNSQRVHPKESCLNPHEILTRCRGVGYLPCTWWPSTMQLNLDLDKARSIISTPPPPPLILG